MKLFARLRTESPPASVARTVPALARYGGARAAARPATLIATGIWLPEPLEDRIAEMIKRQRSSRSALIRKALSTCVYGACRCEQMREQRPGFLWRKPIPQSCSPDIDRRLDNNTDDFKIWLPRKLKADLTALAQAAGMTFSNYVRTILILHFMGRQSTPERDAMLQTASEQPADGQV